MKIKYLNDPIYLQDAYEDLTDRFRSKTDFDFFYEAITTNENKSLFLEIASTYLFLCKRGDWVVNVPHRSNPVIDYFTNSFKLTVLCALIECLYGSERWITFSDYLLQRANKDKYPITDSLQLKELLGTYSQKFGATKRLEKFLSCLPANTLDGLLKKCKINGQVATVKGLANILYHERSDFVHNAQFVLLLSAPIFDRVGEKDVFNEIPISDLMEAFEIGLVKHFST